MSFENTQLSPQKNKLIEILLEAEVLSFGSFTLKSGRTSPYFFNLGNIFEGKALDCVTQAYAELLHEKFPQSDTLFGPAYKGIPLASVTAVQVYRLFGMGVNICFDRKEAKAHGEGGEFVGSLFGNIVLVDDVITAGSAVRSSLSKIERVNEKNEQEKPLRVQGLIVAMDREEAVEKGGPSAIQALKQETGMLVEALLTFSDLLAFIQRKPQFEKHKEAMLAYRNEYGVQ